MIEEVIKYYHTESIIGVIGLLVIIPLIVKAFKSDDDTILYTYGRSTLPLIAVPLLALFVLGITVPEKYYRVTGKAVSAVTTEYSSSAPSQRTTEDSKQITMRVSGLEGKYFSVITDTLVGGDVYMENIELKCEHGSMSERRVDCQLENVDEDVE